MNDLTKILIGVAIVGVVFVILWRKGYLLKLSDYIQQTREELKKCTWPTWEELKASTVLVFVSIALLGAFTFIVDRIFIWMVLAIS